MTNQRAAVILSMHPTGYSLMRDLAQAGVPVVGLDHNPARPGLYSRLGDKMLCPSPEKEQELLDFLVRLATGYREKPVLFAANDVFALAVARHHEELAPHFELPMPELSVVEKLMDKGKFAAEMHRLGIPHPQTTVVRTESDLDDLEGEIIFPCVAKPSFLLRGCPKAVQAESMEELKALYREVFNNGYPIIVQEVVPGGCRDLWSYQAYYDRHSESRVCFTVRKIRQHPARHGTACMAETAKNSEVKQLAETILGHVKYVGLVDVEFKWDRRENHYKVIEINARIGLWHSLGKVANANLALAAYRDMIGLPYERNGTFVEGRKWRFLRRDIETAFGEFRAGELGLVDWLKSVRGKKAYPVFSWGDIMPFLVSLPYVARLKGSMIKPRLRRDGVSRYGNEPE